MSDFKDRVIRAAKLDARLYEEVEADKTAMGQALAVVLLSSLAAGIGDMRTGGFGGLIGMGILALLRWLVWSVIIYFVGTRLLPEKGKTEADYGQLLRTIGFAASPGLIRILGIIPGLMWVVGLVAGVWGIAATVVAVRQALDYTSTGRAILVCVVGWVISMLVLFLLMAPFMCGAGL